ncbi:MAG: hypothetical protein M1827_000525 [Pycnora praestabilis]|nr:MAG: hypothetical protein M1827_000525 [Pycnora praestabilis]
MSLPGGRQGGHRAGRTGGSKRIQSVSNNGSNGENHLQRNNRGTHTSAGTTRSPFGPGAPSQRSRGSFGRPTNQTSQQKRSFLGGQGDSTQTGVMNANWRDPTIAGGATYANGMNDLFQKLKNERDQERKDAIARGLIADPEVRTGLDKAITLVGTCQDMCPEFERVDRIVQNMVDGSCEKINSGSIPVPWEDSMVKKYRRPAAGLEEQLPSDIRPPIVLQKTTNYLFQSVVGGSQPLASVHSFIRDRLRCIRNDFSIQRLTKAHDLRIAIECYERIARFHILALHQLSRPGNPDFSHKQEREQLDATLLSLMYYYDDSRDTLQSPNEAEFRAYCIIFQIQDRTPDVEERASTWRKEVFWNPRVQRALRLYAAASDTLDDQGPLRPTTCHLIAQGNFGGFWDMIRSNEISYLMACVAEMFFGLVRKQALISIWASSYKPVNKPTKTDDWILSDLLETFGFDDEDQVQTFCEEYGFSFGERTDSQLYLDLTSVPGMPSDKSKPDLSDPSSQSKQQFSQNLVEQKRYGRTFLAIIDGISASKAREDGLIKSEMGEEKHTQRGRRNNNSLFLSEDSDEDDVSVPRTTKFGSISDGKKPGSTASTPLHPFANPFAPSPSAKPFGTSNPSSGAFDTHSQATPAPRLFAPNTATTVTTASAPFQTSFNSTPSLSSSSTQPIRGIFGQPSLPAVIPNLSQTVVDDSSTPAAASNGAKKSSESILPQTKPTSAAPQQFQTASTASPPLLGTSSFLAKDGTIRPAFSFTQFDTNSSTSQRPKDSTLFQSPDPNLTKSSSQSSKSIFSPYQPSNPSESPPQRPSQSPSFEWKPASFEMPQVSTPSLFPFSSTTPASKPPQSSPFPPLNPTDPLSSLLFQPTDTPAIIPSSLNLFPTDTQSTVTGSPVSSNTTSFLPIANSTAPRAAATKPESPKSNNNEQILDSLSATFFFASGGLLEQFVEHTAGPIVLAVMQQVEEEKLRVEADEFRHKQLARRYIGLWKELSYKLGLLRKGRERRKRYAEDMRRLAKEKKHQNTQSPVSDYLRKKEEKSSSTPQKTNGEIWDAVSIVPQKAQRSDKKRKSLPSDFQTGDTLNDDDSPEIKRQRQGAQPMIGVNSAPPRSQKNPKIHHHRSSTLGDTSTISAFHQTPQKQSPSSGISSFASSFLSGDSILSASVLARARAVVPKGRTDTTHTPYFKMKALGLDPDAGMGPPVTPASQLRSMKRVRNGEEEYSGAIKSLKRTPPDRYANANANASASASASANMNGFTNGQGYGHFNGSIPPDSKGSSPFINEVKRRAATDDNEDEDEDEEIFAQSRSIREALSESINLFHDESAHLSQSMSSSQSSGSGGNSIGGRGAFSMRGKITPDGSIAAARVFRRRDWNDRA